LQDQASVTSAFANSSAAAVMRPNVSAFAAQSQASAAATAAPVAAEGPAAIQSAPIPAVHGYARGASSSYSTWRQQQQHVVQHGAVQQPDGSSNLYGSE
jgi:hypothetical protein